MIMEIPEPLVAYRSWAYAYDRPRRMGWPSLVRTGYNGSEDSRITVRAIMVHVRQSLGGQPTVESVTCSGFWTGTDYPVSREKISLDARPGRALCIYAPDWVEELVTDALRRATAELPADDLPALG